jgi:hypothetical protein
MARQVMDTVSGDPPARTNMLAVRELKAGFLEKL